MHRSDHKSRSDSFFVAIADDIKIKPELLLEQAIELAGFWNLASQCNPNDGSGRALILVDLYTFDLDSPVITRVDLVEKLIDDLAKHGWTDIAVGSSADSSIIWSENRAVPVLADLVGYKYETPSGTPYDVVDLSEDLTDAAFPPDSILAGTELSRNWLDADLRIVFSKCKTDQRDVYALCLNTLISALPLADKDYYYRLRINPADALNTLICHKPPHFAIVDACRAAHGSGGQQAPAMISTNAVIAGADLLAVDCAVAAKMGADPAASLLVSNLMATLEKPKLSNVTGNRCVFQGFRLPDPMLVDSTRARDKAPILARTIAPWLQRVDESLFAFKNPFDAKVNSRVAHYFGDLDNDPASKAGLIYWNYILAGLEKFVNNWHVIANKDALMRRITGISPETLACGEAEYRAMEHELDDLEYWLDAQAVEERPLRWRYLDGAIVFDYRHDYPVPFEDFVKCVDISRTIQFMNDYIGGTILPVEYDSMERPVRQVERNLYLPQPNYLVWWGGKEIDVSKIESIYYYPDRQRMYWKTIKSENESATYDDGIVTFESIHDHTRVTVFGRQLFELPPFWEQAKLDLYPQIKDFLVKDAYETFFSRTFSNLEALLEGRDIAIGRPWHSPTTPNDSAQRPIVTLMELAARSAEWITPLIDDILKPSIASNNSGIESDQGITDALGFTHFREKPAESMNSRPVTNPLVTWSIDFYSRLIEAMVRDGATMGSPAWNLVTGSEKRKFDH